MARVPQSDHASPQIVLRKSVGRVILEHDRDVRREFQNGRGAMNVMEAVDAEYQTIKQLPVEYRVDYFWAIMMHLNLEAGYAHDFIDLVGNDCRKEYVARLKSFIGKPQINTSAKGIAQAFLMGLEQYGSE